MKPLFLLLFFHYALIVTAQKNNEAIVVNIVSGDDNSKINVPFAAVKVIDVRFDKSNIGCAGRTVSLGKSQYKKMPAVFPDSFHHYLPLVLSNFLAWDKSSNDTLVLLVKQFRLTDYFVNGMNQRYEPATLLKLSVSFYRLRNNELFKLFSVADLLSKKWSPDTKPDRDVVEESRAFSLLTLLRTLFENRNWQSASAGFAVANVEQGIRQRFALPVLNDTVLRRGIYKSFQEFKANRPSLIAVNFVGKQEQPDAITDSFGKNIDLKNWWGACDGKKRYIFFRGSINELEISDKSFKFLSYMKNGDLAGAPGFGDYAPQTGIVPALLVKAKDNSTTRSYFYLNMDEENVYLEEVFGKSGLKEMQKDLLK